MAVFMFRASPTGPAGTPLSDYAEGDLVKLNEGGSPVEFYVSKHDYESGLNGAGRTLVVRKDCYDNRVWDSGSVNAYASSDLDTWFNGTYKALLDPGIQEAIGTTKFYNTLSGSSTSVTTYERAVFALSLTELGESASGANVEGSALPIASTLKVVYQNGNLTVQWTRSPYTNDIERAWSWDASLNASSIDNCNVPLGSRPIFTLPSTILVGDDGLIV